MKESLVYLVRDAETGRTPYTNERFIAKGGMGTVYRMSPTEVHKVVKLSAKPLCIVEEMCKNPARLNFNFSYDGKNEIRVSGDLKRETLQYLESSVLRQYLLLPVAEGQTLQDLRGIHNVVESSDSFFALDPEGYLLFVNVQEYIPGKNLRKLLHNNELSLFDAAKCALDVSTGLKKTHERGFIHRDIKPENIHYSIENQRAVLFDLGVAITEDVETYSSNLQDRLSADFLAMLKNAHMNDSSRLVGTLRYFAPEQTIGIYTPAIDIFALGLTLFELFTGKYAFPSPKSSSDKAAYLLERACYGPDEQRLLVNDFRTLSRERFPNNDVPDDLVQALEKALDREPTIRKEALQPIIDASFNLVQTIRRKILGDADRTYIFPVSSARETETVPIFDEDKTAIEEIPEISNSAIELIGDPLQTDQFGIYTQTRVKPIRKALKRNGRVIGSPINVNEDSGRTNQEIETDG